jgi:hypothetical protein
MGLLSVVSRKYLVISTLIKFNKCDHQTRNLQNMTEQVLQMRFFTLRFVKQLLSQQILITTNVSK